MDSLTPTDVNKLYEAGAFLIFLNFPEKSEFGVDCMSWNVGPKFKGLKMIPPGVHFVYYSAVVQPNSGAVSPRIGFFHNFKSGELLVKKWDPKSEDMSADVGAEEVERMRFNLKSLDSNLGAYPLDKFREWYSISSHISPDLLDRLSPENGRITMQCELVTMEQTMMGNDASSSRVDRAHPVPGGSVGSDITRHSLDSSNQLDRFLAASYGNQADPEMAVLGEQQFAFVCFLLGQVYAGFEQWKQLTHLLCSCRTAIKDRPNLFSQLLMTLHFQLKHCPQDFFVDIISKDNFLTETLGNFFASVQEDEQIDQGLRTRTAKFKAHLTHRFKWRFEID